MEHVLGSYELSDLLELDVNEQLVKGRQVEKAESCNMDLDRNCGYQKEKQRRLKKKNGNEEREEEGMIRVILVENDGIGRRVGEENYEEQDKFTQEEDAS